MTEALQQTARKIREKFPEATREPVIYRGDLSVPVKRESLRAVSRYIHDDPEMAFDYIVHISSVDRPKEKERFEVVYEYYSIRRRQRIRLKTRVTEADPTVDTVSDIWLGADWQEREAHDMMGIRFNGHPDLRRILLPDDFSEGYPLRKDYPVEGKGWRDDMSFITPGQSRGKPEYGG